MKDMTITYEVGSALYVNITNRCSNRCDFCIRNNGDGAYGSNPLWLEREPTKEEVYDAIVKADPTKYTELVFCGYGEPTERLFELLWISSEIKKTIDVKIRVNTNGHSSLIHGINTAPLYKDVIDAISISLNAPNAKDYDRICHSRYGEEAFNALVDFAKEVKTYVPDTMLSVVDAALSTEDIEKCKALADTIGVTLRVREYIGKD